MTVAVIGILLALALVDGACSGFRAGLGRTGLIRHSHDDRRAACRGVAMVATLLIPASAVFVADLIAEPTHLKRYVVAGRAMLAILLPYALAVGIALAAYAALDWRTKYLAIAVVLGPFTLIRPAVATAAAIWGLLQAPSIAVAAATVLAAGAVLTVEPLENRRWAHPCDRTSA